MSDTPDVPSAGLDSPAYRQACEAYRRGEVTLSKAAEMVAMSLRDFASPLREAGITLNYDAADPRRDLEA